MEETTACKKIIASAVIGPFEFPKHFTRTREEKANTRHPTNPKYNHSRVMITGAALTPLIVSKYELKRSMPDRPKNKPTKATQISHIIPKMIETSSQMSHSSRRVATLKIIPAVTAAIAQKGVEHIARKNCLVVRWSFMYWRPDCFSRIRLEFDASAFSFFRALNKPRISY